LIRSRSEEQIVWAKVNDLKIPPKKNWVSDLSRRFDTRPVDPLSQQIDWDEVYDMKISKILVGTGKFIVVFQFLFHHPISPAVAS
jgi:hypothetical protein